MIRVPGSPFIAGLALIGCGSTPDSLTVDLNNEAPTTVDDIVARFRVDRRPGSFTVGVLRTGAPATEYTEDQLDVEDTDSGRIYTLTIPSRQTQRDQTWILEGRARYGGQIVTGRAQVTVENTPPSSSVRLEPANPTTLDDIRAVVSVDDPDDNPVQVLYRWEINGEPFFVTTPTFPARATTRDDVISVTVSVRDDVVEAPPTVAQIVVQNIAPGAAGVELVPNPAAENGPLVCTIVEPAIDLDGDEVSYLFEWFRNDAPWSGATSTTTFPNDTIPPGITVAGDVWSCTATPTDGSDEGPSASSATEIIPWSGPREFSTCGARGRTGPTEAQCATAYAGTNVEGEVEVAGGYQIWTAPTGGRFRIQAGGARGGHGNSGMRGGNGALQEGTFQLEIGDEIHIVVGQPGTGATGQSGGGGGGTFVVRRNGDEWEPLLIAGGGAGVVTWAGVDGCPGNAGQGGTDGSGWDYFNDCRERSTRLGQGGSLSREEVGSAGGGFLTNGADDDSWGYGKGGEAFTRGARGGGIGSSPCGVAADGGFGGGGSGNGCYGGGGAGGYSGGDGGYVAGGAGSYNDGEDPVSTRGGNTDAEGWVYIDLE